MTKTEICRILIIDDNVAIHQDFRKILTKAFSTAQIEAQRLKLFDTYHSEEDQEIIFEIDSAVQGEEGLEKVRNSIKNNTPYAIAFVDIRIPPGLDGIETISYMWSIDPHIEVIISTAYSDYQWEDIFKKFGNTEHLLVLKKPFDPIEIRQAAHTLGTKWLIAQHAKKQLAELIDSLNKKTEAAEKTAEQLAHNLSLVKAAFSSITEGILVIDSNYKVLDWNQSFVKMWDIQSQLKKGSEAHKVIKLISQLLLFNPNVLLSKIKSSELNKDSELPIELSLTNGRFFEFHSSNHMIDNQTLSQVWHFKDITDKKKAESELIQRATHDTLTGLPNRILFQERLQRCIIQAKSENKIFAVILIGINQLKLINTVFGFNKTDILLKKLSEHLMENARKNDVVARLNEDEFAIILTNFIEKEDCIPIIHRLLQIASFPFEVDHQNLNITLNIGVSFYPSCGIDASTLLNNANYALNSAKEQGINQFQIYNKSIQENIQNRLKLEDELKKAYKNNELEVYYQPIIGLKENLIIGAEALLRWNHPARGLLLPADFMQVAENSGLIIPIGLWVLRTVCQQIQTWNSDKIMSQIRAQVAVNLSSYQVNQKDLIKNLVEILSEYDIPSHRIELEITENNIVADTESNITTLQGISKLGISLVLDDFGIGFSNLSALARFPIKKIKIDKSFTSLIGTKSESLGIISAIIAMAKNLNLQVLAEGVETKSQLDFFKEKECDQVQGFYFSTPLPVAQFEKIVKEWKDIHKGNNA